MSVRQFGIEEELLLVDGSGKPAPRASELLERISRDGSGADHQRRAAGADLDLQGVVDDLRLRTLG